MPSTPYVSPAPGPRDDTDRRVKMAPTLLRRSRSRLRRTTEKFVACAAASGASPVWMFSRPTLNAPTRPVIRPPASIGISRPVAASSPMRRL